MKKTERKVFRIVMMFLCNHDYVKLETEPHFVYYDYTGFKVGVFKCKCTKCGKISNLKFY